MIESCGWADITFIGNSVNITDICKYHSTIVLEYPKGCSQSICSPYVVKLNKGTYLFQLYGAQGGSPDDYGGKGGYSSGIINADHLPKTFYAFIGAMGFSIDGNTTEKCIQWWWKRLWI